jgi:hypothetical protein
MLTRLRTKIARWFGAQPRTGRAAAPAHADLVGFPLPLATELRAFDALIRRLGMDVGAVAGMDPLAWKPELGRVKAQRHRVLTALAQASEVPQARRAHVEACLLQGWHLVFHCYATATGMLPEEVPGELEIKRGDLRRAYAASRDALQAAAAG